MNKRERAILIAEIGDTEPRLALCSNTRIDTGRWWRRSRLWIVATDRHVVLLAAARRHYVERIPIEDCQQSHYCHTTGELVIKANKDLQFNRLAMAPTDALYVLDAIRQINTQNTQDQYL